MLPENRLKRLSDGTKDKIKLMTEVEAKTPYIKHYVKDTRNILLETKDIQNFKQGLKDKSGSTDFEVIRDMLLNEYGKVILLYSNIP